jgi:hypothetical protein
LADAAGTAAFFDKRKSAIGLEFISGYVYNDTQKWMRREEYGKKICIWKSV